MTTRAKFTVASIQRTPSHAPPGAEPQEMWTVTLHPVYSPDRTTENYAFWNATPNGSIQLGMIRPHEETFRLGQAVYVDFTPAES